MKEKRLAAVVHAGLEETRILLDYQNAILTDIRRSLDNGLDRRDRIAAAVVGALLRENLAPLLAENVETLRKDWAKAVWRLTDAVVHADPERQNGPDGPDEVTYDEYQGPKDFRVNGDDLQGKGGAS